LLVPPFSGWRCKNRIQPAKSDRRAQAIGTLSKFLFARINPLQAGQITAALLFDLGTIDIR
jgi:hypothetical protein